MRIQGRAGEVEALTRRLDLVASGRRQVVFVEGAAGIGKSRLLDEAVAVGEARGFQIFLGRSEELERNRPFGVLADAFGCERRSPDPARAALGRIITGDVGELTEFAGGPALQFRAVEAFVELVESAIDHGPVLLVAEDAHWADPASLVAVHALARRLSRAPLLVLVSFRPSPHQRELERLVEACVDDGAEHVRLGPLTDDEVTALVTEATGTVPGPGLRRQLTSAGGNPLFVLELVKALEEEGVLELVDGRVDVGEVRLPRTLRLTILRRLSGLSEPTLALLRLAAVLGSTFRLSDLLVVSGRSAVDVLPALQEAYRSGLVDEAGPQLAFRHDLVREAIYSDLPVPVRHELHRAAGRALAAAGAAPDIVATHLAIGATRGDAEAVRWLRRAARQAAPRAPGAAADLLGRAAEVVDVDDPERDRLAVEQVDALGWAGRMRESEALAREVLGRRHDRAIEGELRVALSRTLLMRGHVKDLVAAGAAAAGGSGLADRERRQLRATAAWAHWGRGELAAAESAANSVRSETDRVADEAAWCLACAVLAVVNVYRGHLDPAITLAGEVVSRAEGSDSPDARRMGFHHTLAVALTEADRMNEAAEVLEQGRRRCEAVGSMWSLHRLYHVSTMRRFLAGDWDNALSEVERLLTMEQIGCVSDGIAHSKAVLIAVHRGELETAAAQLRSAERALAESGPHPRTHWVAWSRGLLHEARGSAEAALGDLELAWAGATAMGAVSEYPRLGPDLVRLALRAERRVRAGEVAQDVAVVAERMGSASARGAALRCRGLLESDPELLQQAVIAGRAAPRPLERALTCEDAAVTLGRRGRLDEARLLFDEAEQVYEELGARHDEERMAAAMRAVGIRRGRRGARKRPQTGWDALTETELRVVHLAAEGMTNGQIAARLFISPHTVATHLAHVFRKLGLASRTELAAEAARRSR